eukprot:COSAG02_NODE_64576_length_260_cov_0.639752_2_plen_32_part_01
MYTAAMPKLKRLIGDAGATFRHFYVNTPVRRS